MKRTKKALKEKIRRRLEKLNGEYRTGWPYWFLYALLMRHPYRLDKLSYGCKGFIVEQQHNGPATFIITDYGDKLDFSWNSCIKGYGKNQHAVILSALRKSISPYVPRANTMKCMLCDNQAEHMHHDEPTFIHIAKLFLAKFPDIPTVEEPTGGYNIPKGEVLTAWIRHHTDIAKFIPLCISCHGDIHRVIIH